MKNMKKTLSILALAALLASACSKADSEMHRTSVIYPSSGTAVVFADQTRDTLRYVTTEPHSIISTGSWCKPDNSFLNDFTILENSLYTLVANIDFEPNTTGEMRAATVTVLGTQCSASAIYCQVPYLAVLRPTRMVNTQTLEAITYELTDSAHHTTDSVAFFTYGDWSLTPQSGEWVSVQRMQGMKGENTVRLTLTPNTTDADRRDTLFLTSNGVTDKLPLLQLARKQS